MHLKTPSSGFKPSSLHQLIALWLLALTAVPLWSQAGGLYSYFAAQGQVQLPRWSNFDHFGKDALHQKIRPTFHASLLYGLDFGNRHRLEVGLGYASGQYHFKDKSPSPQSLYYFIRKKSLLIPLHYTFVWTQPSKTYRKDWQYGIGVQLMYQYDLQTEDQYFRDSTVLAPAQFFTLDNPDFELLLHQHPSLQNSSPWSSVQWYIGIDGNVRYFLLDYTAAELYLIYQLSLLDPRHKDWRINLTGKKYARPHIQSYGLGLRIVQYLPYW